MIGGVSRWWAARSLTVRLTIVATVVLALGLAIGAAGLATIFYHARVDAVDANVRAEAATVAGLVESGQLPDPLPVPAAQPVLAQVIDGQGTVRAATPSASRIVPIVPLAVLAEHDAGSAFTTNLSALGASPLRVTWVTARLGGEPVTVVSAVSFADVGQTLSALFWTLTIAVPVVLVAAGIATWLAVGSALRPVDELRAAAEDVSNTASGSAPHLPVPTSGDELSRLAETLNRMLERLHRASEQQRTFVADAAHELRSPIASIRTQLDVALSTPTSHEEWVRVGADVLLDVDRVAGLADDLLFLAKLDAGAPSRREIVDIVDLFDIGDLRDRTPTPLWVSADRDALRRAIGNLVSNARRHARTTVDLSVAREGSTVLVTVDDDGDGVPAEDRERVFERWVRLDDARTRDAGGSGLGLAIARAVARNHGGDVTLKASAIGGARAELRLPAEP